jgi:hypothetical protein
MVYWFAITVLISINVGAFIGRAIGHKQGFESAQFDREMAEIRIRRCIGLYENHFGNKR